MRLRHTTLGIFLAAILPIAAATAADEVLLLHGHIYTGNPQAPWAEALAVRDSRIAAIGTDRVVAAQFRGTRKAIDLHGRTVALGQLSGAKAGWHH